MKTQILPISLAIMSSFAMASTSTDSINSELPTFSPESKQATAVTKDFNDSLRTSLNFANSVDFELADKGFIARQDNLKIMSKDGKKVAWELGSYDFLLQGKDFDSIHPSMQRQAVLNMKHGLYQVRDGIYQVRGYDLANITFIRSENGWIVFDPLTIPETAEAAYELFKQHAPEGDLPIKAVVYSHSHADHFGGVKGIVSQQDVDSGKVQIIAPRGFTKHSISENVLAGTAMSRRVLFQYGTSLEKGAQGQVDAAIGKSVASGELSLIVPTLEVEEDIQTITVDGLEMVMQNAPETEAPSEMNTYIPEYKTYWGAETTVGGLHNLYTLRGAFVRDSLQWADVINEALYEFGFKAETLIASHSWPRWGNENVVDFLEKQRDMYGYLHDESLRLANHGVSINDIQDEFYVPDALSKEWYLRGYHGSYHRNAKAVLNKYLGYFDMNPANLIPHSSKESAKRYVEDFGTESIMSAGFRAFERGDYRWCAEIVNKVVFTDPENKQARYLQADCLEQLGYQSESSGERNVFLVGADELRRGIVKGASTKTASADMIQNMPTEDFLNYMGVRLNGPKAAEDGFEMRANLVITDEKQKFAIEVKNGRMSSIEGYDVRNPNFSLTMARTTFDKILTQQATLQELIKSGDIKADGKLDKLAELTQYLDNFEMYFNIIEPQDHSGYSYGQSKTGESPINR
ncbi:MBL fold metallo-hydrolase [Vibrio sp. SCSIO 43135]|uniref:alkyl/aryl-sulfatase n=1 Tax=Vibrio sp. SCSIO 43135 TaxID=2819096 RepID=UPI002074B64F|nr:alkyl sulfatase dimerization domain-containing protein [Vibrio sp. SCSIO 43135]USD43272.1 MBL fold metallo-hydrolase [Vibrio sp. SCSIO 43135]